MSSRRACNRPELERIAEDLPTTPDDLAALRRARDRTRSRFSLERIDLLNPPDGLPRGPRRQTAEGWEPFELP